MLPWLLGWTRLIADEEVAVAVANEAVARAASGRTRLAGVALRDSAKAEAARLLARGVAAVPGEGVGEAGGRASADAAVRMSRDSRQGEAGSRHNADARHHTRDFVTEGPLRDAASAFTRPGAITPDATLTPDATITPDATLTPTERLTLALRNLAPHERLACVCYVLDGASTSDVAALLRVPFERAADILAHAFPSLAAAVGETERPDFAALMGTQVAVVVR